MKGLREEFEDLIFELDPGARFDFNEDGTYVSSRLQFAWTVFMLSKSEKTS